MQALGQHSRELIQAIKKTESLHIQSPLKSLPKFIMTGDQSAGKSSITEALTGITLPRKTGTCTRCPYQLTTTACRNDSQAWSAKVLLHRNYHYMPQIKATDDARTYDGWMQSDSPDVVHFATVTKKEELEGILISAQLAILNPGVHHMAFSTRSRQGQSQASSAALFSPNVISLEIEGPDLPELSFYDLPGAINSPDNEDEQYLYDFIGRLLTNYIKDDKALVLLACSITNDIENCTALRYVRQCKAASRCIGVLTKPDLLDNNRTADIVRLILQNKKQNLGHGWYVTKQLSQDELEELPVISHAEARIRERDFFRTAPRWSAFAAFSDRMGIPALQSAVSQVLTSHILNELPAIVQNIDDLLTTVTAKLAGYPEQPRSPADVVSREARNVQEAMIEHIRGDSDWNPFRTKYRELLDNLTAQLNIARPEPDLSTPTGVKKTARKEVIHVDLDSDTEPAPTPKRKRGPNGHAIPATPGLTPSRGAASVKTEDTSPKKQGPQILGVMKLDWVRTKYHGGFCGGLPNPVNPKVTEVMILTFLRSWPKLVEAALDKISKLFYAMIKQRTSSVLEPYRETQLLPQAIQAASNLFYAIIQEQTMVVERIVAAELHRPISLDANKWEEQTQKWHKTLRMDRDEQRTEEYYSLDEKTAKQEAEINKNKTNADWKQKNLGADPYAFEVDAMAKPLAYYDIAAARMVDSIAMHLELGLMHRFQIDLPNALKVGLKTDNVEHCAQLLEEDAVREERRRFLVSEQEKLREAKQNLENLPGRNMIEVL